MPFKPGFVVCIWIFSIANLINFIWLFGFVVGSVIALLTFFQVTFASFLWPFLLPSLIRDSKKGDLAFLLSRSEPSKGLYGSWSLLVVGLLVLGLINSFVGEYSSVANKLVDLVDGNYMVIVWYTLLGIGFGNLLRVITLRLLTR